MSSATKTFSIKVKELNKNNVKFEPEISNWTNDVHLLKMENIISYFWPLKRPRNMAKEVEHTPLAPILFLNTISH